MSTVVWDLSGSSLGKSVWQDERAPDRPATTESDWGGWTGPLEQLPQVILLGAADAAPWVQEVLAELQRLATLRPGWDGAGGRKLSPSAIQAAISFMNRMLSSSTLAPQIVPTSAGGIQLEWHSRGIDLEIEADRSGGLLVFVDGVPILGEEWEGPLDWRGQHYVEQAIKLLS